MRDKFDSFARWCACATGSAWTFGLSCVAILLWLVSGPFFGWSDTWQLVVNTATTVITFLMVFVIQATQNRESEATQLKLDELIHAVQDARNALIGVEDAPREELERQRDALREDS